MKLLTIALTLILVAPVAALADTPPTTRPAGNPGEGFPLVRPFGRGGGRGHGMRGEMNGASTRPYTQEEWEEALAFLDKNSPNRAVMIGELDLNENSPLRVQILKQWRNYKLEKDHFPELSDLTVKRFQIEDVIFGLVIKGREGHADLADIRKQVHEQSAQLVQLGIDERKLRIDNMKKLLEKDKNSLQKEERNVNQMIDDRTNNVMKGIMGGPGPMHSDPPVGLDPTQSDASPQDQNQNQDQDVLAAGSADDAIPDFMPDAQ